MTHIAIVGSGVVGQATGKGFAKKGHRITYIDINQQTIVALREQGLAAMQAAEVDWRTVEVVMLAVSTPSRDGQIVLDYIEAAARDVGRELAQADRYITVVVRSTVPPTTTMGRILPILERVSGKRVGHDFGVGMNPEFLRQVSSEQDFIRPWITVLGVTDRRQPKDWLILPIFIGITYYMSLVKAYALFTINEHKWLTRAVAVVDGKVARVSEAAQEGVTHGS